MIQQLESQTIAFIGGGMMGGAIIHALVKKKLVPNTQIIVSEPNVERQTYLKETYGIVPASNNAEACKSADIVILATKPQILPKIMVEIFGSFKKDAVVMSIMAGIPMATIQANTGHNLIVRTMPNTPAQIGEGMTVWTATNEVTDLHKEQIQSILLSMGLELFVNNEDALDMATAICGSGPVYAFLMMEALVDSAVHMGLQRADAKPLVMQTILGSTKFAMQSDKHLAELKNMVTSPGGTTAEAIYQMEKGGLRTLLSRAVFAAYKKAKLLGKKANSIPSIPMRVDSD